MFVAIILPRSDFLDLLQLIGNAAVEALMSEDAELGLGHVQPTAMLGRVVPLEPLDEAAGLGGGKDGVERCGRVRAEIVLHQYEFLRAGKMRVGQIPVSIGAQNWL